MALFQRNDTKTKSWEYDFWHKGKRYRKVLGNISKTRANEIYQKARVGAREGRYEEKPKEDPLFNEIAEEYLEDYASRRRPRSAERHGYALVALKKTFGGKRLSSITPHAIDRYKRKRKKEGRSEVTINRELAFLKNMFNVAIQWGKVAENPMKKVETYREDNSRTRYLTEGEEARLFREMEKKPHIYRVVLAGIHTGLRRSELLSLTWNNINFEHRLVTVEAGYAKNHEARSVPMSLRLTQTLQEIKIDDPNAPVFLNSLGKPYRDVKRAFNNAVKRAGIQDFTFHDLRHTFASRLVMSGVDLTTVKELMGHKHINMTLRYAHLSPEHKHSAITIFDAVPGISPPRSDSENVLPPK